jgi:hypothetical protein
MVTTTFSMMTNLYAHHGVQCENLHVIQNSTKNFSFFYNLAYDLGLVVQIRLGCTGPEGEFLDKIQTKVF